MPDVITTSLAKAQAKNVTFELHTLGWEGFQNLCGHVLTQVLGQTVTVYSPTRDVGQDGAFQGIWKKTGSEIFEGRFIIQCKFTSSRETHLSLSQLTDELSKAELLAKSGHARSYILITNASVSGEVAIKIREAFLGVAGIDFFELFGNEWLTQRILESHRLRALVPRIYGLGDLSQILDQRVYRQAQEILQSWKENLSKFVPTQAHERSIRALLNQGFVLLLGEPMAGKSTIAAALALAAADTGCLPVFISQPSEFRTHWNPDEPKQFFWVDDAFGATQFNASRAAEWNSIFPLLNSAIKAGARVLFTSRDYIFRQAMNELKTNAFPLLRNAHVVIRVEELSVQEKESILYNHIRLGTQTPSFKTALKPFLPLIAQNPKFFPEIARRLGDPFFTHNLDVSPEPLRRFVEEPTQVLGEIIAELDLRSFAALALLFVRAGRIAVPPSLTQGEADSMALLGASIAQLIEALRSMDGGLVASVIEGGNTYWKFRHPSIHDAMTASVAQRPELIDIYLRGAKVADIISEVLCGDVEVAGAKVHVPASRYSLVTERLKGINLTAFRNRVLFLEFLYRRCAPDFLAVWFENNPEQYEAMTQNYGCTNYRVAKIISRLHAFGKLPEKERLSYVSQVTNAAIDDGESTFVNEDLLTLFNPTELAETLIRITDELVPNLNDIIDRVEEAYDEPEIDPSDHFSELYSNFETFKDYFEDTVTKKAFGDALDSIDETIKQIKRRNEEREQERLEEESDRAEHEFEVRRDSGGTGAGSSKSESTSGASSFGDVRRSLFDDVDH